MKQVSGEDESNLEQESGAILDLRLAVISATIQKAKTIPEETRTELLTLVEGLKSEVSILKKTHLEEALSIAGFADVSAHEASRSRKNRHLAETALEGLQGSIRGLENSHPVLAGNVNRFATILSSMGL